MRIVEVNDKSSIAAFHALPFRIYSDDPNWIHHVTDDVEKVFDPQRNRRHKHDEAKRWLAYRGNETVGRIAAFTDSRSSSGKIGGMGFFECINDQEVANALFDTCKAWLKSEGAEGMDGPINFGERDKYWGVITKNFEAPPYYGQNYNPSYYVDLLEEYGFKTYFEQFIYFRNVDAPLQEKYVERAARIKEDPDYTCKHIERRNLARYAGDFKTVFNRAWAKHDGFKPISTERALALMRSMKPIIDEKLMWFVDHKGTPVGFYLSLPEINPLIKKVGPRLHMIAKIKLWLMLKLGMCKYSFAVVFGIDPEHHGKGVEGYLFQQMANVIRAKKLYEGILITWIGDFNPKMISIVESLGATKHRTMATYRYLFDLSKDFERAPIIQGT